MAEIVRDPNKLLESFKVHLTDKGGIRESSIPELISLMANCGGLLAPKCISLCVIASSETSVQSLLCDTEVWDILLKWLQEATQEEAFSFLTELMQVYLHLPVTYSLLKRNVCPKMIKTLSKKSANEKVRSLAFDIVKKWMDIVSGTNTEVKPKKRKLENANSAKSELKTESAVNTEDPAQKRRKTVKVRPTKLRTAGIEDEPEVVVPKSRHEVLAKKTKIDNSSEETSAPIESFHQSITVTPTELKKSPTEIHESSNFINALTHSQPIIRKRRKNVKLEPLIPPSAISDATNKTVDFTGDLPESEVLAKISINDQPAVSSDKIPNKKRVTWAPEQNLVQISFFEVDEGERVNVARSIEEVRQKEHSLERQLFKRNEDVVMCGTWRPPVQLEVTSVVEPGSRSTERETQLERERHILQTIYFTRESIPFTPEEPDVENFAKEEPVQIPIKGYNDQLLVTKSTEDGSSMVSLNPNVADLVKSLALNFDHHQEEPQSSQPLSATSPPAEYMPQMNHLPANYPPPPREHFEDQGPPRPPPQSMVHRPGMGPRMQAGGGGGLPFMPGGPAVERPHPGMRPRGGPPMRPPMGPPYRHPQYPPDGPPPHRYPRGGPPSRPTYRGGPPSMFNGPPGGRQGGPPMRPRGGPPGNGAGGVRPEQICKFYQQRNCRNGSNCPFFHPTGGYPPPRNW